MNIKEQVEWEQECARRGAEQYYASQDALKDKGRQEQCNGYTYIMRDRLLLIAQAIEQVVNDPSAGFRSAYNNEIRRVSEVVSYNQMAFFATQIVLRAVSNGKSRKALNATKVLASIGERIETEVKCTMFERANPEYYDTIVKSFKQQKVQDYDHKRRVLMTMFKDYVLGLREWGPKGKIGVGSKIMEAFFSVMGDLFYIEKVWENKKHITKIVTTVGFDDWLAEFEKTKGLMQPAMLPLKIPPLDWDENKVGGYYTPRMQTMLPFIKTKGKEHKAFVDAFSVQMHRDAVNKLQKTAWKINARVLEVMQTVYRNNLELSLPSNKPLVPEPMPAYLAVEKALYTEAMSEELMFWKAQAKQVYFEEAKRKAQVMVFMQTLRLAGELSVWPEFYFAYSTCFRGRVYCATSALSPQGDERARSLLTFKEGVRLGEAGVLWLAVHGANCFGIKGTHMHRVQWVREREQLIREIATDPLRMTSWVEADKPYQFLAFCFEWAEANYGKNPEAVSHLPVGIDGSCNGLQHFSAILRDPIGAKATNLCGWGEPSDIYEEVSGNATKKLRLREDGVAELILRVGIDRNGTKKQTMTLPYGATKQACREYTFEWCVSVWGKFEIDKSHRWTVASYLSPIIWESIGDTVVAAMIALEWLQCNVGKNYTRWVSHVGFPVYQYYKNMEPIRINTKLAGGTRLSARDVDATGEPNLFKQKLGIVPNFIHSVDGSHLVMTVLHVDLPAYSMVHDEYATHAGNMSMLHKGTRETFYELHSTNQLARWAEHQGISAKDVPPQGKFDLSEVLTAINLFG